VRSIPSRFYWATTANWRGAKTRYGYEESCKERCEENGQAENRACQDRHRSQDGRGSQEDCT